MHFILWRRLAMCLLWWLSLLHRLNLSLITSATCLVNFLKPVKKTKNSQCNKVMRRGSANIFMVFMFSQFRSDLGSVGVRWVWMRLVLLQLLQVTSAARTHPRLLVNWREQEGELPAAPRPLPSEEAEQTGDMSCFYFDRGLFFDLPCPDCLYLMQYL